jgi:hypothetical protein
MRTAVIVALFAACDAGMPPVPGPPDLGEVRLTAAATDGTVQLRNSDFSVDGAGTAVIGAFHLQHGAGTIELEQRTVQTAVYQRQMFDDPTFDLTLYQALAVERDRIWILWFYCRVSTHQLDGIYYEATDGTEVTFETAYGTCQDLDTTSTVAVQFPAIDLAPPPLIDGYQIDGGLVKLDGARPGTVTLGGAPLTVYVFNTVDCSRDCGSPGWLELHALLWDDADKRVCFGIFYLRLNDPDHVQLAWSLTLPSLVDPAGDVTLPATWKAP